LTKLFKPFSSGWKDEEGSGLGLATSHGIVKTHGGHMSVTSAGEGKGTTFTIVLPPPRFQK
jgi:signal transduction histidine kinase